MKIDKSGPTYQAYLRMLKIWAGAKLADFARRWLGRPRYKK